MKVWEEPYSRNVISLGIRVRILKTYRTILRTMRRSLYRFISASIWSFLSRIRIIGVSSRLIRAQGRSRGHPAQCGRIACLISITAKPLILSESSMESSTSPTTPKVSTVPSPMDPHTFCWNPMSETGALSLIKTLAAQIPLLLL